MTWFSEDFYWLPAKGKFDASVHLYVDDGWKIRLDMDDCTALEKFNCQCDRCGYDDTALRELTLDELKGLHEAIGKAIVYVEGQKKCL